MLYGVFHIPLLQAQGLLNLQQSQLLTPADDTGLEILETPYL